MRRLLKVSALTLCVTVLVINTGCSKNNDKPVKELEVITSQVSNILIKTAIGGGWITASGGLEITASGVVYSTNPTPSLNKIQCTTEINPNNESPFHVVMDKLRAGTDYYVRAYATDNEGNTWYGDEQTFTTYASPVVATGDIFYISGRGLVVSSNITNTGGLPVTERGVVLGTSDNPTIDNTVVTATTAGTGDYSVEVTQTQAGVTYYIRAYAKNAGGVFYGNQKTYTC